jgi:hypothetical protein
MDAAVVHAFDAPIAQAGERLITVAAAGLHPIVKSPASSSCSFGSASLDQIRHAIADFFSLAATAPFQFNLRTAPLREIETLWNEKESATRRVFQPQVN